MIHHVYANRSNSGDWLSARGIQRLLDPLPITEHLCDAPFVPETIRALRAATPDDLVVIGGGGLFMDYFRPFWESYAELAPRLRTCIWGVGVVDLKAEATILDPELLRPIVRDAALVVLRDDLSRTILAMTGLPAPVLCPSVAAVEAESSTERGLLHVANLTTVGEAAYRRMVDAGHAFAALTGRTYRETNNRFEDGERGLARNLDLYRRSDVILSSRLHGCIIGLAMGRPVVAVSGDRKVEAFMDAVGLGDWVVDDRAPGALEEALRLAVERQPSAVATLARAREANRRVADTVRQLALAGSTGGAR